MQVGARAAQTSHHHHHHHHHHHSSGLRAASYEPDEHPDVNVVKSAAGPSRPASLSSGSIRGGGSSRGGGSTRDSRLSSRQSSGDKTRISKGGATAKAQERRRLLLHDKAEREAELKTVLDTWFAGFDHNNDKQLNRDELRLLLAHLYPGDPPEEGALDFLILKATEINSGSLHLPGNLNGLVPWDATVQTVTRYSEYIRQKRRLDALMEELDVDASGTLDAQELHNFLQRLSPGLEVIEEDVRFILEYSDVNQDGAISCDELWSMVQVWRAVTSNLPHGRKKWEEKRVSIKARALIKESAPKAHASTLAETSAMASDWSERASQRESGDALAEEAEEEEEEEPAAEANGVAAGEPEAQSADGFDGFANGVGGETSKKRSTAFCIVL